MSSQSTASPCFRRLALPVLCLSGLMLAGCPTGLLAGDDWLSSFEEVHAQLAREYPFTAWKGIDWDALHATYAPRIAAAEADGDHQAYYMALREYVFSIPDGHMSLGGGWPATLQRDAIGGGYGLGIVQLDDGRIIVHVLTEDGPAEAAGMAWGAEVLAWDGVPIVTAVGQTSTLWATVPPATAEGRWLQQCRYLVRGPEGRTVSVTFRNPGESTSENVELTAEDDDYETLRRTGFLGSDASLFWSPVKPWILPEGYGYIRLTILMPTVTTPFPAAKFERILRWFIDRNVPGIILDVRGNSGGEDVMAPAMMGHFFTERRFYERTLFYDKNTRAFEPGPEGDLYVEPLEPHYGGTLVVLVDAGTLSAGEGIAMMAQWLPQATVVGFHGTYGSFGVVASSLVLPGWCILGYPDGASVDSEGRILLDSDAQGVGGVEPDVRVPITEETVYAQFEEEEDVALDMAIQVLDAAVGK